MRAQMRVERVAHGVDVPRLGKIDMSDLRTRMHTGIGTTGALQQHLFATEGFDGGGQCALHGFLVGLDLPAGKRRAVIFDSELVARHYATLAPAVTGVPRRNSCALIGCLPARCTCVRRTAPVPQAMVS